MTYLNREKKMLLLFMAYMGEFLSDDIPKQFELDPSQMRRVKTAGTNCRNVFKEYSSTLDDAQKKAVNNTLRHNKLALVANTEVVKELLPIVDSEDVDTLLDYAMATCQTCAQGYEKVSECELRKVLLKFDTPPAKERCNEDECPFNAWEVRNK